jgi:DNA-binding YbaB/EbfC family protein
MNMNPFDLLKNAQEQMGALQDKLGAVKVTGSAGAGMVELELSGRMEIISIKIAPELLNPDDIEMLEDLIVAAHANAMEKNKEVLSREMGALAKMMNIPGFPGMT